MNDSACNLRGERHLYDLRGASNTPVAGQNHDSNQSDIRESSDEPLNCGEQYDAHYSLFAGTAAALETLPGRTIPRRRSLF